MRIAALVVVAGCTVPPPFHTFETASTLPKGDVQLMAAGGGGGGEGLTNCCGGAAARVRLGIGGDQELSLDGSTIFSSNSIAGGLRAGYKIAPWSTVAFVGGAGAFFIEDATSAGADLGVIVSAPDGDAWIPYTALRFAVAIPTDRDVYTGGGVSETFTVPVGVSRRFGAHWQGMFEVGGIGAISELRKSDMMVHTQTNLGLYGGLAVGWQR